MLYHAKIKNEAKQLTTKNLRKVWLANLVVYLSMLFLGIVAYFLHSFILGFLSFFLYIPLAVGLVGYNLNLARKKEGQIFQIFWSYRRSGLIILTVMLYYILTFLWSMLFLIPGIIAFYCYSMSLYLLNEKENFNSSALEILNTSKKLMDGYKMDYFIFQISFIGWFFLGILTLGLAFIYVIPYYMLANATYYDNLKTKR